MPTPLNVGMKLKVKTIVCYYNNYYVSIKLTHQEFTDTFRAVAILKGKKANPFLFTKKALRVRRPSMLRMISACSYSWFPA